MFFSANDLNFALWVFLGSAIATYLCWIICWFNGKVIFYLIRAVTPRFTTGNSQDRNLYVSFDSQMSVGEFCLIGATPLAILSIFPATIGRCFNSVYATSILEIFIFTLFLFIPISVKKQFDLFGFKILQKNLSVIIFTVFWCFIFAVWGVTDRQKTLDYIISNTNPDMWAYVRRFAAMSVDNLNFYDSNLTGFDRRSNSACTFFLDSPKKFSSWLGSLIVYPFPRLSLGIAVFQGMLGATLLICLFKEWFDIGLSAIRKNTLKKIVLITWVFFSPPIYWLLISAYFSNTLFIIIICLTLRASRKIAILGAVNSLENFLLFFAALGTTFAFYPAFIPVILCAYLATIQIYTNWKIVNSSDLFSAAAKLALIIIALALVVYFLFPSQSGLYEIKKSLNVLDEHGANFVPLNAWSLLQEKPKPMPAIRDFGWYINLIISLPICALLFWKIWQSYKNTNNKDLLAGLVGVSLYGGYLLAFIPLEYTYRLMKIAISLIYPLAIFGLLPVIIWYQKRWFKKDKLIQNAVLVLAIAHAIWHVHVVFNLRPFPSGSFTLVNKAKLENARTIAIVGCQNVHESQFYERLVGLTIARQFPNLSVLVVRSPENVVDLPPQDLTVYGKNIANYCHFEI